MQKPNTYQVCKRKRILRDPSITIYAIYETLVHTIECYHSTQIGAEHVWNTPMVKGTKSEKIPQLSRFDYERKGGIPMRSNSWPLEN